jgi:hypothetical protein
MVQGFELTIPPSRSWSDLTRDLVATGVTPLDFDLDRFQDLLVLVDQVVSETLDLPGATSVKVTFSIAGGALRMTFEAVGARGAQSPLSELALSVLTDEHWLSPTGDGILAGFTLAS